MPDELTKALLLEEVVEERAIAEALYTSVTLGIPFVHALTEVGAVRTDILARYLARNDAPFLRQVAPLLDLVDRLPEGLCARLLAIPVRRDAITGTIDVVVPDPGDPHPGAEIAFHLGAPVRLVRSSLAAIDEAIRRLRARELGVTPELAPSIPPPPPPSRPSARPPVAMQPDADRLYDSRPRAGAPPPHTPRQATLPPPDPSMQTPAHAAHLVLEGVTEALRPSRVPGTDRQAHVVPAPSSVRPPEYGRASRTPPWGTPIHSAPQPPSDVPASGLGSEIPIPLTRRTFTSERGGTQRPPPLVDPSEVRLGEGIPVEPGQFRDILEVRTEQNMEIDLRAPVAPKPAQLPSFIPGAPPLTGAGSFAAYAPQLPFTDVGGILAALRVAGARDEVLELVLTGARIVALKVALFVVKRGGYLGWACTPEFGDRAALQTVLVPLDVPSAFDEAVRDGLYLGPLRHDEVHAALLHVMRGASRDVALVPIRVTGKTAVIIVADHLGDTMLATRRLEELSRAAGDAFARIVRMRR